MKHKGKTPFKPTKISQDAVYGIVSTQWNKYIVDILRESVEKTLLSSGVKPTNILRTEVPGAFELPLATKKVFPKVDAVIAIGVIIEGETPHFHFIANTSSTGLMKTSLEANKPVIYGVLTTNDEQQAIDRADPEKGNKGAELAESAMMMVEKISII